MSTDNDMLQGFTAVAHTEPGAMNIFILGLFFSIVYIVAGYILLSAYKDVHEGNRSVQQLLFLGLRLGLLLVLLTYFFINH